VAQDHRPHVLRELGPSLLLIFIGFNLTFFPQFLMACRVRRATPRPDLQGMNQLSTLGAGLLSGMLPPSACCGR
jgi:heme/copper-type cytochrome/quinol oxidase subunit 1